MKGLDFFSIFTSDLFILYVVVFVILTAGLGGWVADKKGYSPILWFLMCLLTGITGLIAIAGAPSQKKESESDDPPAPQLWLCQKCQTENSSTADSCRGCGSPKQRCGRFWRWCWGDGGI